MVITEMDNLQIFNSEEFGAVRTVTIENEPWFVGKDVATALGYANPKNAVPTHVSEEDKLSTQIEYAGQRREVTVINESGLYALIFGSKLESAKRFKHWVTSEVLPAIRKHGVYAVDELLSNPEMAIKAFTALKEERCNRREVSRMQRLCPACFTELAEEANYCPVCGKCMREPVGQTLQYVGGVPITTVFEIKDCAIHIGKKKQGGE